METKLVSVANKGEMNFIFGQSHFIKTVEDLYEALVQVGHLRFGIVCLPVPVTCPPPHTAPPGILRGVWPVSGPHRRQRRGSHRTCKAKRAERIRGIRPPRLPTHYSHSPHHWHGDTGRPRFAPALSVLSPFLLSQPSLSLGTLSLSFDTLSLFIGTLSLSFDTLPFSLAHFPFPSIRFPFSLAHFLSHLTNPSACLRSPLVTPPVGTGCVRTHVLHLPQRRVPCQLSQCRQERP